MSLFGRQRRSRMSRRSSQQRRACTQARLASLTVLRAQSRVNRSRYRQTWIQDVNDTFTRMFRANPRTTFADALHAYANQLEGNDVRNRVVNTCQDLFTQLSLNGTIDSAFSELTSGITSTEDSRNEVVNTPENTTRRSRFFPWL